MSEINLGGHVIGGDNPTFVIAEIGHNHQGNLELARQLIVAAKSCGVDAVKFQKRSNRTLFTEDYFNRPYNSENSFGETYGQHREALEFGKDDFVDLQALSESLGLVFFSTAFDEESADFLSDLAVPAFKIASGDLTNTPLIEKIAKIGKPVFISTGGGTIDDVDRAVEILQSVGTPFCLMQCTAGYPPAWNELNLRVIQTFREKYGDCVVGFSSHDNGIAMSVAAAALGAKVIEKHFTLNRTMKGTDHVFSLEPQGMTKLVRDLKRLHVALGDGKKVPYLSEFDPVMKMSKKLVARDDLPRGHKLTRSDLEAKSPGDGLRPFMIDNLIGRTLTADIGSGEAIDLSRLS